MRCGQDRAVQVNRAMRKLVARVQIVLAAMPDVSTIPDLNCTAVGALRSPISVVGKLAGSGPFVPLELPMSGG